MADQSSVPFWWVVLFVLLALGVTAGAVLFVGGEIITQVGLSGPV